MPTVSYNRQAAVAYAERWALSRNPKYYDYQDIGGDCTNFASQCVYAGSGVMNFTQTYGWYYLNPNEKAPAWTGVEFFYNFMTTNSGVGPFAEERPLSGLSVGDIIQTGQSENFTHSLVLTRIIRSVRGRVYYICAHTNDAYQRNLSTYDFSIIRGIHILGVRK